MKLIAALCSTVLSLTMATPFRAITSEEIERQLDQCDQQGVPCIENLEAAVLTATGPTVTRKGNVLTIRTKRKIVAFSDHPDAGADTVVHQYLGFLDAIGYHLVIRRFWEGWCYVLVSEASGEATVTSAIPYPSPSRKRAVSVSASEAYNPNEIVIWSVTPEHLAQEYQYEPKGYALYKFITWDGDTTVHLENFTNGNKKYCPISQFMTVNEILTKTNNKWQLSVANPPNAKCQQ